LGRPWLGPRYYFSACREKRPKGRECAITFQIDNMWFQARRVSGFPSYGRVLITRIEKFELSITGERSRVGTIYEVAVTS
jgi:hypothetical protein